MTPATTLDEVLALRSENARLRAALKPFALSIEMLEVQNVKPPDGRALMFASDGGGTFLGFATVGDLREASRVLEQTSGGP
jgi:hypothetical protein